MKVLLVRPKFWECHDAPLSLAVLAAVARDLGHNVKIVDFNKQVLPTNKGDFDVVGITGMTSWQKEIVEVAQQFPDQTVIVGGSWATLYSSKVLAFVDVDYVCVGEGEQVWTQFLTKYPDVQDVAGLGYKKKGQFTFNAQPLPIADLNSLPFPAWDLVSNLKEYVRIPLWSSRGCPYHCTFCDAYRLFTRKWRGRNPELVVQEIEWLVNDFGINRFTFADENPTFQTERFIRICQLIVEKQIEATFDFDAGLRVDRLPHELLLAMKRAGFKRIQINPESGCQRVLDEVIHKSLDLKFLMPVVQKCLEIGLDLDVYFVIGFPWETKQEIEETVGVVHKLRGLGCNTFVGNAMPLFGTQLYEQAKKEGYLRFDGEELTEVLFNQTKQRQIHALTSPHWTPDYIMQICHSEYRADLQDSIRRHAFTKRGFRKLLKNPMESLKMLRKAL